MDSKILKKLPEQPTKFNWLKFAIIAVISLVFIALAVVGGYIYIQTRGPVSGAPVEQFIIPTGMSETAALAKLEDGGYIKNTWFFEKVWHWKNPSGVIKAGGYQISKSLSVFRLVDVLMGKPLSVWVTIPEGLRKEEIAKLLSDKLGWGNLEAPLFLNTHKDLGKDYAEGVYYPETYLVPVEDGGDKMAKRMLNKFNDELAKLTPALNKQNIKWTTAVKIASLIQREAASKADMPIISAVLWNRLNKKQRLEIDSTIQYALGTEANGWWPKLDATSTGLNSPYNTYRNYGLPPTPISNPGKDALEAAVNPAKSSCLFYIHDNNKVIHCATTFAEHRANILKYLK